MLKKIFYIDLIGVILFKIALDFSYYNFITENFSYAGYLLEVDRLKIIEGWIALFFSFLTLQRTQKHKLYPTFYLIYLLSLVPTITLYGYGGGARTTFMLTLLAYVMFFASFNGKKLAIKYITNGKEKAFRISLILTVVVLIHYILVVGLGNFNLDFENVYNLRSEYGDETNEFVFSYLNGWVSKILNLFLICYFLNKKELFKAGLFVFIQILLFGFSGHKITLFSIFLIFFFYFLRNKKYVTTILIYGVLLFISLILANYYLFNGEIIIASILIRRAFFVPSYLNNIYLDFFSHNPHVIWSNSIFKYFLDYPYGNITASHVIGDYMGHPDMGANTGIIGSGYMHFGVLGVAVYILIIRVLLYFISNFKNVPNWMVNSIILLPMLSTFISSDLFTSMLTHGLLISCFILYAYGSSFERNKKFNLELKDKVI